MRLEERVQLSAYPQDVWDCLWDIERVARCVPGCTGVRTVEDGKRYVATFQESIGPYSVGFEADVVVVGVEELRFVALRVDGEDKRLAISMRADLKMQLEGGGGATAMGVEGDVEIVGKLASLGQSVVKRKTRRLFDQFVDNLTLEVEGVPAPVTTSRGALPGLGWATAAVQAIARFLRRSFNTEERASRPLLDSRTGDRTPEESGEGIGTALESAPASVQAAPALQATGTLEPFRLLQPDDAREAARALDEFGDGAWTYGGGAELLLLMRRGLVRPEVLVDVKKIPELKQLRSEGAAVLVGAAVTHDEVANSELVWSRSPVLGRAAARLGNVRVRCQGTLGGNLGFADPHSDPPAALLLHDAVVVVQGPERRREIAIGEFIVGPYETVLERNEIVTSVLIPALPEGWGTSFLRMERFNRPTVNVAVGLRSTDGEVAEARLVVGCIGPRPQRLEELETQVRGARLDDVPRMIEEAGPYLTDTLDPVDDMLGSGNYKVHLARVLLARAWEEAMEEASYGS